MNHSLRQQTISSIVSNYLASDYDRRPYTCETGTDNTSVTYRTERSLCHMRASSFYQADDRQERLSILAYCSIRIPEQQRMEVARFLVRVNSRLFWVKLELDMDDGIVRTSISIHLRDYPLSRTMLANMEDSALSTLDDLYPLIMNIAYGTMKAEDAYARYCELLEEALRESV